ncbi:hypothetical protein Pan44_14750 [Caulifigura coniformis]|uniref:Tll0287-like domain-containing protein n=1 Tax=Caulifigura coniformis TaxID=2527983 RepID=A0A517SBH2_9PLAN|nr:DUF3365 domain-containing protein [Caulifigura coniformis]QDT53458.1 hypothetical protein Pan44_14750 [Caulifigura coniformis]
MQTCTTKGGILSVCITTLLLLDHVRSDDRPPAKAPEKQPPSLAEARARAQLLHETLHSTLHVVHRDFYREDDGLPIPAASMTRVFRHLEEEQGVVLRWLAVDGEAMNVDHKARDDFERAAVKAIQADQKPFESREGGVYRRAAAITLRSECLKCHVPNRKSLEDRFAGLIISMPFAAGE